MIESDTVDAAPPSGTAGEDLTGQRRMAWNLIASWAGYLVFLASEIATAVINLISLWLR